MFVIIIVFHGSIVLFDTCDYGFCHGHRCQGPREEFRILLLSSVTVLQLSKNSKQITDAMKLVAYAKLRRAQQAVVEARPFSYARGVFSAMVSAAWRAVALPSCHC